ncbi:MAG: hypothetical protein ACLU80_15200 [Dorea sp.]
MKKMIYLDQTEYTQAALVTVCMAMDEGVERIRDCTRMSQQA